MIMHRSTSVVAPSQDGRYTQVVYNIHVATESKEAPKENQTCRSFKNGMVEDLIEALELSNASSSLVFDCPFYKMRDGICAEKRRSDFLFSLNFRCMFSSVVLDLTLKGIMKLITKEKQKLPACFKQTFMPKSNMVS